MAATVAVSEQYGNSPGTTQDTISNLNFGNISSYNIVPASNPITCPTSGQTTYSVEKWVRLKCSGTYTKVDNLQFWLSAGTPSTGVTFYGNQSTTVAQTQTYVTPVGGSTVSTIAVNAVPTSDPADNNISIDQSFTGSFDSNETAYSDYLVLQMRIADTASPGNMTQITWTFQYDEQ